MYSTVLLSDATGNCTDAYRIGTEFIADFGEYHKFPAISEMRGFFFSGTASRTC